MSARSIEVFGISQEAQGKLDYFLCGVTGALFAYLGEHYIPRRLEPDATCLEPLALLFLMCAFFAGIKRLEHSGLAKQFNYEMLDAAEKAGKYTKALSEGPVGVVYNEEGGQITNQSAIAVKRQEYMDNQAIGESLMRKAGEKSGFYYRVRNRLLYLGFLTVLAAKLLTPYLSARPSEVQSALSADRQLEAVKLAEINRQKAIQEEEAKAKELQAMNQKFAESIRTVFQQAKKARADARIPNVKKDTLVNEREYLQNLLKISVANCPTKFQVAWHDYIYEKQKDESVINKLGEATSLLHGQLSALEPKALEDAWHRCTMVALEFGVSI